MRTAQGRLVAAVSALTALVIGAAVVTSALDDDGALPDPAAVAGIHVLEQYPQAPIGTQSLSSYRASAASQLTNATGPLRQALALPGVTCFGIRVPWNILEEPDGTPNLSILDQARSVVNTEGDCLTVRIMAGRHTPQRVLDSCPTMVVSATTIPEPFSTTGEPNTCFVDAQESILRAVNVWGDGPGAPLGIVHTSHFAYLWAEFYDGPEIQQHAGSTAASRDALVEATTAIWSMAIDLADEFDRPHEGPLSGHGPLMSPTPGQGVADRVSANVVDLIGAESPLFYVQGNGWDHDGIWGAPSQTVEQQMDLAINDPRPLLGVQMIQPQQFDWPAVMAEAERHEATYGEIYRPSFVNAQGTGLAAAIASFDPYLPDAPTPPSTTSSTTSSTTTTTTTTTLPPTTTTVPETTTTTVDPHLAEIAQLEADLAAEQAETARLRTVINEASLALAAA